MSKTTAKPSAIDALYKKYEYMASYYANTVFNFERFGYEKDDIVQEFRIKIYTAIISYAEKWRVYKETDRYKPVPIKFYLKAAMVNRRKDFIKLFNNEDVANIDKVSIETDGFDYNQSTTMISEMDLKECVCEINGVDLFQGLIGRKRQIFSLYLEGFTVNELNQQFTTIDVAGVISSQVEFIKTKKNQLFDFDRNSYYMANIEDD